MIERLRNRFEIVAGECRWRAAKAAGLKEAPCFVRELSDQQVLILQLIENLQRTDLSPIEEADGYARVLEQREDGKPIYTVDRLAREIGKPAGVIYRKLRLARLEPNCAIRAALENGTLSERSGVILASIPDAPNRAAAAHEALFPQHEEGPLSVNRIQALVDEKYRRDLETAGFDLKDGKLLPEERNEAGERVSGGACADCPFRVGVMKKLDPAIAKGQKNDLCTNAGCFQRKKEAFWAQWQARETRENRRALSEAECAKLFRYGALDSETLVDISEHPDGRDLKPGERSPGPWKKLIRGAEAEVLVVRDPLGKVRELVDRSVAISAAVTINKVRELRPLEPARPKSEEARKAELAEEDEEAKKARFVRGAKRSVLIAAVARAAEPEGFWLELLRAHLTVCSFGDELTDLVASRGWFAPGVEFAEEEFLGKARGLSGDEVRGLYVELIIGHNGEFGIETEEQLWPRWGKLYGVNVAMTGRAAVREWEKEEASRTANVAEVEK